MKFDREVLCVSAVLHDLGLTMIAPVEVRFEIEGADLAKDFLARKGMSERHLEIVWDAIALHTTPEIPLRKCSEVALCQLGIAADLGIAPPDVIQQRGGRRRAQSVPVAATCTNRFPGRSSASSTEPESRVLESRRGGVRTAGLGI